MPVTHQNHPIVSYWHRVVGANEAAATIGGGQYIGGGKSRGGIVGIS